MSDVPYILSLVYRKQIDEACKPLPHLGLKHFVMYMVFNDGSTFILSNVYPILKPYYQDELYKEDFTYSKNLLQNAEGYYLCDKAESLSRRLMALFAEKYSMYPVYNLVRNHSECTFVFSAIKGAPIDNGQLYYQKTVKKFENFCIHFVDQFIDLIIKHNPNYRHSFILNNKSLRDAVIKQGYIEQPAISLREQECLWLAAQGKSVKQIAQVLTISPFTVEKYLKNIREKLYCKTLIEAIIEGVHRGIIGKLSAFTPMPQSTSIDTNRNFARPDAAMINAA